MDSTYFSFFTSGCIPEGSNHGAGVGEYMLNYPFANSFNLENAFVYSTLLGKPKWRAYDDTNKKIN